MNKPASIFTRQAVLHLLVIYLVWGSTYLAIRVGVREGSGFPPFFLGGTRALTASLILLAWNAFKGSRLRLTKQELLPVVLSGLALWLGGNGFIMVGEKFVDSSLAALIIAGAPLITALIESVLDKKPLSPVLLGFILIGIAGIGVLSVPNFRSGVQTDVFGTLMILLGSLFWSIGTIIQGRNRLPLAPTVNAGYQMLFGGVAFIIAALLLREPLPTPRLDAWLAWGYLVVFGSIIAFTSFLKVLHLLPMKIVMTYSYINPIVALILGYLILSEPITIWTIAGTILVLVGVFGVFSFHRREARLKPVKP